MLWQGSRVSNGNIMHAHNNTQSIYALAGMACVSSDAAPHLQLKGCAVPRGVEHRKGRPHLNGIPKRRASAMHLECSDFSSIYSASRQGCTDDLLL